MKVKSVNEVPTGHLIVNIPNICWFPAYTPIRLEECSGLWESFIPRPQLSTLSFT